MHQNVREVADDTHVGTQPGKLGKAPPTKIFARNSYSSTPASKGPLKKIVHGEDAPGKTAFRAAGRAAPYAAPEVRPKQAPARRMTTPQRSYVRVRGLPFSSTAEDVAEVFQNFRVTPRDVFMGLCTSGPHAGHPDGQAFVQLANARVAEQCLEQLNGATVGSRYLEIFATDETDFDRTQREGKVRPTVGNTAACTQVIVSAPGRRGPTGCIGAPVVGASGIVRAPQFRGRATSEHPAASDSVLRLRGLPFTASAQDVANIFDAEYQVAKNDVFLGLVVSGTRTGAPDGQAYIRFRSPTLASEAEKQYQRHMLGNRYIELFKSSEAELERKLDCFGAQSCDIEEEFEDEDWAAGWLRFRGLRFQATKHDVIEFCAGHCDLQEDDIVMKFGADGRPSGECFVRVDSEETAIEMQRELDSKVVDGRYIEVFMSSFSDAARNARVKCRNQSTPQFCVAAPYARKQWEQF